MVCRTINTGGITAIVCTRGARPIRCKCGARGDKLCDWPIGDGKTCDKPMCDRHATNVGKNLDYCKIHAKMRSEHEPANHQDPAA